MSESIIGAEASNAGEESNWERLYREREAERRAAREARIRNAPRRKVWPNDQVIHIFAQGEGREARSGNGNVSCERDILRSYRTPIAAFCPAPDGARVVVITSCSYSSGTSQHMPHESSFPPGIVTLRAPFFPHPDIGGNWSSGRYAPAPVTIQRVEGEDWSSFDVRHAAARVMAQHDGNLAAYRERANVAAESVAKDRLREDGSGIGRAASDARRYAEAFGLPVPAWAEDGGAAILADATARRDARRARLNSPANVRKREREAARRALAESFFADCVAVFRDVMNREPAGLPGSWSGSYARRRDKPFHLAAARVTDAARLASFPDVIRAAFREEMESNVRLAAERAERATREESEARAAYPTEDAARSALATLARNPGFMGDAVCRVYPALREAWREAVAAERAERAAREAARIEAERRECEARAAREREAFPDANAARRAWRDTGAEAGFRLWPDARMSEHGGDMIRVSADGAELVTARGARVPLADARRAFRAIAALRAAGRLPFRPGAGESMRAGHFTLHRIDSDGAATFGCHTFAWAEMETLASALDARDAIRAREQAGDASVA